MAQKRLSSNALAVEKIPAKRPKKRKIIKPEQPLTKKLTRSPYSQEELEMFKGLINKNLEAAYIEYNQIKDEKNNSLGNGTDDTHQPTGDIVDKTQNRGYDRVTQKILESKDKYIKANEAALIRIARGTYGICRNTGLAIPKERLLLVPHASMCAEAKNENPIH